MSNLEDINSPQFYSQFENFLETCTYALQDESIEDVLKEKVNSESSYQEKQTAYLKLEQEHKEKSEYLFNLKLTQKRLLNKITYTTKKLEVLNKQIKNVQETTITSFEKNIKMSEDFVKATVNCDEDLNYLYSQFEEKTLVDQINEISAALKVIQEHKNQFINKLQKLKNKQLPMAYERLPTIKLLTEAIGMSGDIETVQKKISDIEKNIQFLDNEIVKQANLLENLN